MYSSWWRFFRLTLLVLLGAGLIFIVFVLFKEPRADKNWLPDYEKVATVSKEGDRVTIHNVRDWTYTEEGPLTKNWIDVSIDPARITRMWFVLEPFPDRPYLSHTMLSFEMEDGRAFSFSIEARKEMGETYSAFLGVTNGYELIYVWGTERDSMGQVVNYLDSPLHLYPLQVSKEEAQALFIALTEETNKLAMKPQFYNSFTKNCTNILAHIVNDLSPGKLPWDISWYLTGSADTYLMKQGFITQTNSPEETRAHYNLHAHRSELLLVATSSQTIFSTMIRALIK